MVHFNLHITKSVISFLIVIIGTAAFGKTATLRWEKVSGSTGYELEVYQGLKQVKLEKTSPQTLSWKNTFSPGLYTYHIRALDFDGKPGEWTAWEWFAIPMESPKLASPLNNGTTKVEAFKKIVLQWEPLQGAEYYELDLESPNGSHKVKRVDGCLFTLKPSLLGDYTYKVRGGWNSPSRISSEIPKEKRLGPFSEKRTIVSSDGILTSPVAKGPNGTVGFASAGTLFQWEPVPGAIAYEFEIQPKGERLLASGEPTIKKRVLTPVVEITLPGAGEYEWRVRAVASTESDNGPIEVRGKESVQSVTFLKDEKPENAIHFLVLGNFWPGYKLNAGLPGSVDANAAGATLAVQLEFSSFVLKPFLELNSVMISSSVYGIPHFGVEFGENISLGEWRVVPSISLSTQGYFETFPSVTPLQTYGAEASLKVQWTGVKGFSIGPTASTYTPFSFWGAAANRRSITVKDNILQQYFAGLDVGYSVTRHFSIVAIGGWKRNFVSYHFVNHASSMQNWFYSAGIDYRF